MADATGPLTPRGDPDAPPPSGPGDRTEVTAVTPDPEPGLDRRRLLWRDSATILIFVVVALLAAQVLATGGTGVPASSTAIPTGIVIGSLPPGFSLPPGVTFGPIIDPSIGIDATPTPIPAITEAPTPTPSPSPRPSPSPKRSPSPRPSVKTTLTPSIAPTPIVTPAPPQPAFNWSPSTPFVGDQVTFTSTSTGDTSWEWTFGDGGTSSSENPTHTYLAPMTYTVRLTVTGPGGTAFVEHTVTVQAVPLPT